MFAKSKITLPLLALPLLFGAALSLHADFFALDPGVRGDPAGAGGPIDGISDNEKKFFEAGLEAFTEIQDVQGDDPGLGPRFNLDNCAGCHAQPAVGGSSPFTNPQVAVATKANAKNVVPFFIKIDGPVREARFKFKPDGTRDGGVHALFTITGRDDAPGCFLAQPDFATAAAQNNLIFRIPTPTFGAGLIQAIDEGTILANKRSQALRKQFFGIAGRENRNGNDGTITRFGWKAQNKSLLIFAGEAYNVEQGVTNELFPQERDETPECHFNGTPEDQTRFDQTELTAVPSDTAKFAIFMRFLAPPTPTAETPSISNGRSLFDRIGCALCHTPSLTTASPPTRRSTRSRSISFPICCCITWVQDWPTTSSRATREGTNFAPRPCGAWASASSSSTMDERRTCGRPSWLTGVSGTSNLAHRKPTW